MTNDLRTATFAKELAMIKNEKIRSIAKDVIVSLPDYMFYVPASSSGKYHPEFALGSGGLVRHIRAAVKFADDLAILEQMEMTAYDRDIAIAALLLHDGYKAGDIMDEYDPQKKYSTVAEHPVIIADKLLERADETDDEETVQILKDISNAVRTHMGQWNTKYGSTETFASKPETKMQKFVHLCDYLASRKGIEVKFDT